MTIEPIIPNEDDPELMEIIEKYSIKLPKKWEEFSYNQKLDYLAERILIQGRTSKKHSYLKEEGWLSSSQLERRRRREIYGRVDDFRNINVKRSNNPSRIYTNPDTSLNYVVPSGVVVEVKYMASGTLVPSGVA